MKLLFITDQLGRNFNLSVAWELYLAVEDNTGEDVPQHLKTEGFNTATLVAKTVTGAVQLFPRQTISTLIDEIMPGLNINLFEGFSVTPTGAFWADPEYPPAKTIQPVFRLEGYVEGSRYRTLLRTVPESANWTIREKAEAIKERDIQPDVMYVDHVPYSSVWRTGAKLGIRFFKDQQDVLDRIEELYPGVVAKHSQNHYIEQNVRAPFDELKKFEREEKARLAKQKAANSPIITRLGQQRR